MNRLFWFSLLLTYLPVTESTEKENCLIQQHKVGGYIGQSAVLNCTVRSAEGCSAKDLNYEWFTYKKHSHIRLNLSSNSQKYNLDGAFLHIKSLHTNDSGVYYCAAASSGDPAPGAQYVGLGTPLQVHIKRRPILMWALLALFVLLAIYNLAVVILIIKKYGCNLNVRRRMCKTENNSTKKAQFSNVLQEMYSRGNLDGGKNTVSSVQEEAASTDFNCSNDDIYQNV